MLGVFSVEKEAEAFVWRLVWNGAHGTHLEVVRDRTKDLTLMEVQGDGSLRVINLFPWVIMLAWQTGV